MSAPDDTLPPGAAASLRDVATASPVSGTDAGLPATLDPDVPNPFWSKGLFVGRHDEVARLERKLREGRSTLLIGGRRVGKTTMIGRLSQDGTGRTLVRADASGWDLSNLETGLGALRGELEGLLPTTYGQASRDEIVHLLDAASPLALVIDEADYLLLAPWGPLFYRFLRWLDDNHMRESISLLLVGGPVLELFRDPDDKGSPPLNTADPDHVWPLGRDAVMELASLAGRRLRRDPRPVRRACLAHDHAAGGDLGRQVPGGCLGRPVRHHRPHVRGVGETTGGAGPGAAAPTPQRWRPVERLHEVAMGLLPRGEEDRHVRRSH